MSQARANIGFICRFGDDSLMTGKVAYQVRQHSLLVEARLLSAHTVCRNWLLEHATKRARVHAGQEFDTTFVERDRPQARERLSSTFELLRSWHVLLTRRNCKQMPILAAYASELRRVVAAEELIARSVRALAEAVHGPRVQVQLGRLRNESDAHRARVALLLKAFGLAEGVESRSIAAQIEGELDEQLSLVTLGASTEHAATWAAIRMQMYLLTQCRRARDTARFLGFRRDRDFLTAILKSKSVRLAELEALSESCGFQGRCQLLASGSKESHRGAPPQDPAPTRSTKIPPPRFNELA